MLLNGTLTYETWNQETTDAISEYFDSSIDVLKWSYEVYGEDIVYACSFGAEAMVLIHLIDKVRPNAHLVFLDTVLHFEETYELIHEITYRYPGLNFEMIKPKYSLSEQADIYGDELWKRNANLCCAMRKIEPLKEALEGKTAWISGLRRDQSPARRKMSFMNKDERFKKIKICPLIHWSWEEIWQYIKEHDLPYNKLHDEGYPSIGCLPCTLPVEFGEDLRAGRWAGTGKTECGLHQFDR